MKRLEIETRILDETTRLFFRHGIRTITMDVIAKNLGISKKTIYLYFRDKEQLVQVFTKREVEKNAEEMSNISKTADNAVDEMIKLMIHYSGFFKRTNPVMYYDLQKYHPRAWNVFKFFKHHVFIRFIENNIKTGIRQKLYRKPLNVKVLARFRAEEAEMMMSPLLFPSSVFKISQVHLALNEHYLYGISSAKGVALLEKYKKKYKELPL